MEKTETENTLKNACERGRFLQNIALRMAQKI